MLVGVAVGGTGVFVGVAVGGTGVFVGVAVGGTGVAVGVAVGGTAVAVGVAVGSAGWHDCTVTSSMSQPGLETELSEPRRMRNCAVCPARPLTSAMVLM